MVIAAPTCAWTSPGYFASGQFNTALDELKQALLIKPEMREAVILRGLVYAAMGETQLAEESFRRTLTLYPGDPTPCTTTAGSCASSNSAGLQADAQFEQALAQPSYRARSAALLARGVCEARSGRMKAAETSLSRAFELDAGNPAIAVNLAEVLYRNGEAERARFYVKRVNASAELANAQSLWLQLRIERRLGNTATVEDLAEQLRKRYRGTPKPRRSTWVGLTTDTQRDHADHFGGNLDGRRSAAPGAATARLAHCGAGGAAEGAAEQAGSHRVGPLGRPARRHLRAGTGHVHVSRTQDRARPRAGGDADLARQAAGRANGPEHPFRERGVSIEGASQLSKPMVWGPALILLLAAAVYFFPADWWPGRSGAIKPDTASAGAVPILVEAPVAASSALRRRPPMASAAEVVQLGAGAAGGFGALAARCRLRSPWCSKPKCQQRLPRPPQALRRCVSAPPKRPGPRWWMPGASCSFPRPGARGRERFARRAAPIKLRLGKAPVTRVNWRNADVDPQATTKRRRGPPGVELMSVDSIRDRSLAPPPRRAAAARRAWSGAVVS